MVKARKQAEKQAAALEAKVEEAEKARKETFRQHQKDKLLLKDALQVEFRSTQDCAFLYSDQFRPSLS